MLSIPGIGEVTAAIVLGETGGLRQYQNPSQIKTLAKKKVLIAVTGKLVEIMFSLARSGTGFDPKYKWAPPGKRAPAVQAMAA